ncbi:DgyrCDS6921 [Dimorphilus gyrociliatus]|uniref:DgyrCDS6921 n=1 Tax=Dimorphilus gyrociliatus TaxID=2664684 RepID=A0A7I8VRS0_9ANNE|nr:DgyrCDS6921 [Dimorphilus gyrociliatus]
MMNYVHVIFLLSSQIILVYRVMADENETNFPQSSYFKKYYETGPKVSEQLWNWLLTAIITLAILSVLCLICLIVWAVVYYKEKREDKDDVSLQNSNKTNYWKNEYTPVGGHGGLSHIYPPSGSTILNLQKWNAMTGYGDITGSDKKDRIIVKKYDTEERIPKKDITRVTEEGGQTWNWKETH